MKSILIADDHPIILSGAEALLRGSDYCVVAKVASGAAAKAALSEVAVDILLLDLQMPDGTGLEVLRWLRGEGDQRPVILLTAQIDKRSAAEAIALGVNGLLLKDTAAETLIHCLDRVAAGGHWIDEAITAGRDAGPGDPHFRAAWESLSPRERNVAELVIQGMRNREIAAALGIVEGTVKLHLFRVYEKVGVGSRTELVIRARDLPGGAA